MALNGAGGLALAAGALGLVRDRLAGHSPVRRRQVTWDDNAAFVSGLGLEPSTVLGSRPRPRPGGQRTTPADTVAAPSHAREPVLASSPGG